jgi:hypothetical protein
MSFVRLAAAIAVAYLVAFAPAHAQGTPEIDRGVSWLQGRIQADGTLQDEAASIASSLQVRSEAALALRSLATVPAALVDAIGANTEDDTESWARRIEALRSAGRDVSAALAQIKSRQNSDGGFGPYPDHDSTIIDTAFALEALATDAAATGIASGAIGYLVARQAADGGFHQSSVVSDHYATVLAMHAIWRYRSVFALADPLGKARVFLLATKGTDGSWHSAELTALALIAILPTQTTPDGVVDSIDALKRAQAADGSWSADSYVTALALRALAIAAAPTTNPDLATLVGRVVNGANSQPLADATVSITGKEARTFTTDASGQFVFDKLVAGTYEFTVAKTGFGGIKGTITLQPGQASNLGDLVVLPVVSPTTVTLRGVVTDSVTAAPINGATVVAGTKSATTNSLGAYEIKDLPPGDISIRVTASGYFAALATATATAGQTLLFSPQLVRSTSSTATIKGKVTNKATDAPLMNATVRLTGANTRTVTTNNAGDYSMTGLAPGPTQIEVTLTGFAKATASVNVELNVTYDFSPALEPIPAGGIQPKLSGRVTDGLTNAAIGVATVVLSGTNNDNVRGDANGFYQFSNLNTGRTIVAFSAPGYQPTAVPIDLALNTTHALSMALYPEGYINPNGAITGRAVDEVSLLAVPAAVVSAELDADTRLFTVAGEDGKFSIAGGLEGRWKVTVGRSGYQDFVTEVLIPPNGKVNLGDVRLKRQSDVTKLPDLIVSLIDRSRLTSDALTFAVAGQVDVQVSNIGNAAAAQSSRVLIYIDNDRDGRFDPAKDEVIGSVRLTALLDPRAFATVTINVSGKLPFRDAPFRVRVDADEELVELNEVNNEASSADLGVCK